MCARVRPKSLRSRSKGHWGGISLAMRWAVLESLTWSRSSQSAIGWSGLRCGGLLGKGLVCPEVNCPGLGFKGLLLGSGEAESVVEI